MKDMEDIELVIKIPEAYYELVIKRCKDPVLLNSFKNGTPLPKGHGDLIDRGKTVERICKVAEFMDEKRKRLGSPYIMAALFIQDNKEEFPTIIEADKAESEDKE